MMKLLHVDDEPYFLEVSKAFLERENKCFRIDSVTSAVEAFELLNVNNYDVVISDYQMPGMDGLEFLQNLRENGNTIPFIMLTGKGREEVAIEALNRGADHYLHKGRDLESLYRTLNHVIREVVEKTRAKAKLAAIEREHQILLNSLPLNIFHINRDGEFVHVNEYLAERYGKKPEEFIGKSTEELFPDNAEEYIKSDEEVLKRGEPQIGVTRKIQTPRGERWVRLDKVPLNDETGRITGLVGFELDITKRIHAQEALKNSERRLADMINFLPDATFAIDRRGNVIAWNRAMEELTGVKSGDIVGKGDYEYALHFYGTRRPMLIDLVLRPDEVIKKKYAFVNHMGKCLVAETVTTMNGKKIWLWGKAGPIYDHRGDVIGVIESIRDLTDRKKAEDSLLESEEHFRLLAENAQDIIYRIQLAPTRKFEYISPAVTDILGYTPEEHYANLELGFKIVHPDDRYLFKAMMQGDMGLEEPVVLRWIHKDGTIVWIEQRNMLIYDDDGTLVAIEGIARDITERKRVDKERKRLFNELEAKNRELERFTYTVSHDLRSPLFAVQGFASLARDDLEQGKLEKLASDLERVENAATKMDRLLNDTLQLSRVGRVANPPEEVPFQKIVEGSLEQVATQIKSSGTDVTIAKDFPTIHVDRARIEGMLVNLIGNSIKYKGEQPSPKIDVGYRVDDGETVFFVKDNGIGIDPSLHQQVFELFYQGDKRIKGTGAGLAIVKRIIEVHGGRIWIESEKDQGCTVCFTLPVQ